VTKFHYGELSRREGRQSCPSGAELPFRYPSVRTSVPMWAAPVSRAAEYP
jgi:hypothetical protein